MKTIIIWFRKDLRIHDLPALSAAAQDGTHVVPLFILNDNLLAGGRTSSNRTRFLLECLKDLKQSLVSLGADLIIRSGKADEVLSAVVKETSAEAIYYTADYTPYAITRDKEVKERMDAESIVFRAFPGRLAVSTIDKLHTKAGTTYKVFTPFWKNWQQIQRRELASTPSTLTLPKDIRRGTVPSLSSLTKKTMLSPDALQGGETMGRERLQSFLTHIVKNYHQRNNDMAADDTSRLSAYFHFGCLSPREIETMLPYNAGAEAWHRQLAWREFYHYIIYNFPKNSTQEFQERYRDMKWSQDKKLLQHWQDGTTGYPIVDAGMRQLRREGWMHNRARLIVGSFLTKDLLLDWRLGEKHFMQWLIDGDEANNNGNWQWIASVGVDPAPVFRRLYNPASQQKSYDPSGAYVRRYVPELAHVPDEYLGEPWAMPKDVQQKVGCIIGQDYPEPIVDHKAARQAALEQYRQT